MTAERGPSDILLVDDGELDEVAAVLEAEGIAHTRLRGGRIPAEIAPPRDLLIVTPRRVERIRRGSPPDAPPGHPLRIIAVGEDSPAMRRRLRRAGLHLLVRLPADPAIWRLLIARALYRGRERRADDRVAVVSSVEVEHAPAATGSAAHPTILIDLSNRGCRLRTTEPHAIDDPITFTIPATGEDWGGDGESLTLVGRVRRLSQESDSDWRTLAVTFDEDLPEAVRTRLAAVINRWASGPSSLSAPARADAPTIPACRLPTLPDLMLDDETDPPVQSGSELHVELASTTPSVERSAAPDRRREPRGRFESTVLAEGEGGPAVLIGRDLSPGGMRIERVGPLRVGDRLRLALHGPAPIDPFVVEAEVVRDDGAEGFALAFLGVDGPRSREIEKLVACLPDVESLEEGEIGGMGAILSELLGD